MVDTALGCWRAATKAVKRARDRNQCLSQAMCVGSILIVLQHGPRIQPDCHPETLQLESMLLLFMANPIKPSSIEDVWNLLIIPLATFSNLNMVENSNVQVLYVRVVWCLFLMKTPSDWHHSTFRGLTFRNVLEPRPLLAGSCSLEFATTSNQLSHLC